MSGRSVRGVPTDGRRHEPLTEALDDPNFYAGDPFPHYGQLRSKAPVAWNATTGYWAVSTHHDVIEVSRRPETFCSREGILVMEIGLHYERPPSMMHTDPPDHTRYRSLAQPAFRPSFVRGLEPGVRRRAKDLIDRFEPDGATEVVSALAAPFALLVISDLLGVPAEEWPRFFEWSEAAIPGATDWPEEKRFALLGDMTGYLLEAAARRRVEPTNDLVSELANATVDGDRLSDGELAMFLVQLLVAGNETTRHLLSGGLVALAEHPGQWDRLVNDRMLVGSATEEMLRWTTPVASFMRTATCDTELHGQRIGTGDPVLMLYGSANRDEAVFGATAGHFDVGRDPNPQLAFGFGIHFCIGAVLARLEARIVLNEILDRYSRIEVAGTIERSPSPVIAGLRSAPLVFHPR